VFVEFDLDDLALHGAAAGRARADEIAALSVDLLGRRVDAEIGLAAGFAPGFFDQPVAIVVTACKKRS
jgi:hypothetical protein